MWFRLPLPTLGHPPQPWFVKVLGNPLYLGFSPVYFRVQVVETRVGNSSQTFSTTTHLSLSLSVCLTSSLGLLKNSTNTLPVYCQALEHILSGAPFWI